MLHIAHILHIVYIQLFKSSLICCLNLLTGFYLSDDDENMPEDHSVPANDDQLPDSPVQQHFMPLQHDIRQSSPFDFHCTMRRLGKLMICCQLGPLSCIADAQEKGQGLSSILHIIHIMHIVHFHNIWFIQATSFEGKSFKIHSIRLRNICIRYF